MLNRQIVIHCITHTVEQRQRPDQGDQTMATLSLPYLHNLETISSFLNVSLVLSTQVSLDK